MSFYIRVGTFMSKKMTQIMTVDKKSPLITPRIIIANPCLSPW